MTMNLVFCTEQGRGMAAEFGRADACKDSIHREASRIELVDARRELGDQLYLDFSSGGHGIVTCRGVVADIDDGSEYGGEITYLDILAKSGVVKPFILRGYIGYFAVGMNAVLRFIETGRPFSDGARAYHLLEIWADLDGSELPIIS